MPDERALTVQEIGAQLARRLREKRLALGLSVDKLASLSHMGRAQIVRIERGEGGESSLTTISLIARGLGVSAAWLAFGVEVDTKD